MWQLDHKEGWALKNCCFWPVMLEKTLESPLDCKEIQPVHPKGDQSWVFIGRTDVEAETPVLRPPDAKNELIWKDPDAGKDWGQEEKGTTGWDGWMASLTQRTWVWANSGNGEGQGSLVCCSQSLRLRHDWATEWQQQFIFSRCVREQENDKGYIVEEPKKKRRYIITDWIFSP